MLLSASLHPLLSGQEHHIEQPFPELVVAAREHVLERHLNAPLPQRLVPRPYPPLQAEGEVVRELGELSGGVPPHAVDEELELGREVGLDPVGEDGGGAAKDGADGRVGEPGCVAEE